MVSTQSNQIEPLTRVSTYAVFAVPASHAKPTQPAGILLVPFDPFLGEGSPTKEEKSGTLILVSLLEHLVSFSFAPPQTCVAEDASGPEPR